MRLQEELKLQKNMNNKIKDTIQKLEKELKKGYQNGVIVQYEELTIDKLLTESSLFKPPQYIYAINNSTKLSVSYKNGLFNSNSGAEKQIMSQW